MAGYFDKKINMSPSEEIDKRHQLLRNKIQRKIVSGFENVEEQLIDAKEKLEKKTNDFNNFDIDSIVQLEITIASLELIKQKIKDKYIFMFDSDLPERGFSDK